MKKGLVVRSKAGRDKDRFYVVADFRDNRAYVCDGKYRRLQSPKPKNPVHLAATSVVVSLPQTDKQLRTLLKEFGSITKED